MSAEAIIIKEDNQGAIALAQNPVAHSRTKYIDTRFHHTQDALEQGTIDIVYCPTSEIVADLCTKSIPRGQFEKLRALMGWKEFHN